MRGADLLVRTLAARGAKHLFTLSGNQIMSVLDAAIDSPLQVIHVRHEAAAVHMADAWGRLTGKPGVALVAAGPGFANCLSALYVARMAESPLILLSGHSPSHLRGHGAFQEMSQSEMAHFVCKASWTIRGGGLLAYDVTRAFAIATSGRPGPVHLSLPVNMLEANARAVTFRAPKMDQFVKELSRDWVNLDDFQATGEQILNTLAEAKRPLVLAGPAMTRGPARKILEAMTDVTRVPHVAMASPRGVNDPSLGAFAEVVRQADLVLLIDKKLDYTLHLDGELSFNSDCRFIQFDPDMEVLETTSRVLGPRRKQLLPLRLHLEPKDPTKKGTSRQTKLALFDPLPTVAWLTSLARQRMWPDRAWLAEVKDAIQYRPPAWSSMKSDANDRLHPVEVCRAVAVFLQPGVSVLVSDGGEFGQWAQACITSTHRVINGQSGAIGGAIPFALAARLAFPQARIAAISGDGAFGFHALEFDTAVRYKLPFVAVVGNDAMWNAEHQIQLKQFGAERAVGCDLLPTRYDQLVRSLGGHGEHVSQRNRLAKAIDRAHASSLPACVNVATQAAAAPIVRRNQETGEDVS